MDKNIHGNCERYRKIRKITSIKTREVFGITIPTYIKEHFNDTFFNISISGTSIILESGCKNG